MKQVGTALLISVISGLIVAFVYDYIKDRETKTQSPANPSSPSNPQLFNVPPGLPDSAAINLA